jgi:glucose-6-phosphate 1-epimerase
VLVSDWGAQVLSWTVQGEEQLYLSSTAVLDGASAIRGGIPVCWPQFADRGSGVKHGWARQSLWKPATSIISDTGCCQSWTLGHEAQHACCVVPSHSLRLTVCLEPRQLKVGLQVTSLSPDVWEATGALHTYFRVADVHEARLLGWDASLPGWDSVLRDHTCPPSDGRVVGEIDRIDLYIGALTLTDGRRQRQIVQHGFADTVVWNPGTAKCAALPDMSDGDERLMVCVEAAQALQPKVLQPGEVWSAWQSVRCL